MLMDSAEMRDDGRSRAGTAIAVNMRERLQAFASNVRRYVRVAPLAVLCLCACVANVRRLLCRREHRIQRTRSRDIFSSGLSGTDEITPRRPRCPTLRRGRARGIVRCGDHPLSRISVASRVLGISQWVVALV